MKSQYITCNVIDKIICYNKYTHPLLINYSSYRKLLQISNRNDKPISAAGFSVSVHKGKKGKI